MYQVVWFISAQQEFDELIEYISTQSPANAISLYHEINLQIKKLCYFPERFQKYEYTDSILNIRSVTIKGIRIFYEINENTITILNVRHGRQEPPSFKF